MRGLATPAPKRSTCNCRSYGFVIGSRYAVRKKCKPRAAILPADGACAEGEGIAAGGGRALRLPIGETVIAIGVLALAIVIFAQTMAAAISPRPSAGVTRRPVLSRFPRTGAGDSGTGRASPHRLGRSVFRPRKWPSRAEALEDFPLGSILAGRSISAHLWSVQIL